MMLVPINCHVLFFGFASVFLFLSSFFFLLVMMMMTCMPGQSQPTKARPSAVRVKSSRKPENPGSTPMSRGAGSDGVRSQTNTVAVNSWPTYLAI